MQVVELNFAVESCAKGFDDATLEDWAGVCEDDLNDDDQNDDCDDREGNTPAPGFRYARARSLSGLLDRNKVSDPGLMLSAIGCACARRPLSDAENAGLSGGRYSYKQ